MYKINIRTMVVYLVIVIMMRVKQRDTSGCVKKNEKVINRNYRGRRCRKRSMRDRFASPTAAGRRCNVICRRHGRFSRRRLVEEPARVGERGDDEQDAPVGERERQPQDPEDGRERGDQQMDAALDAQRCRLGVRVETAAGSRPDTNVADKTTVPANIALPASI